MLYVINNICCPLLDRGATRRILSCVRKTYITFTFFMCKGIRDKYNLRGVIRVVRVVGWVPSSLRFGIPIPSIRSIRFILRLVCFFRILFHIVIQKECII